MYSRDRIIHGCGCLLLQAFYTPILMGLIMGTSRWHPAVGVCHPVVEWVASCHGWCP